MRVRVLAAFLLVAVASGGALYLHRLELTRTRDVVTACNDNLTGSTLDESQPPCAVSGGVAFYQPDKFTGLNQAYSRQRVTRVWHPAWADPAALALAIGSVGVGLALLPVGRKGGGSNS